MYFFDKNPLRSFRVFASDIKIAHSVFALPFVLSVPFLIEIPEVSSFKWLLILICMVSARSFAMGFNRLVDADIDSLNLRTASRKICAGELSKRESITWNVFFALFFIFASFTLSTLAGALSPLVLVILASYSFWKKWSFLSHFYLGFCLALSPLATGVALGLGLVPNLAILGGGVLFWTAGFDLLYALQDEAFDKARGLKSIPAVFGPQKTRLISRLSFLMTITLWAILGVRLEFGIFYFSGLVVIGVLLTYQHWLVRDNLERVNAAFFNSNAIVGLIFLAATCLDQVQRSFLS